MLLLLLLLLLMSELRLVVVVVAAAKMKFSVVTATWFNTVDLNVVAITDADGSHLRRRRLPCIRPKIVVMFLQEENYISVWKFFGGGDG